MFTKPNIHTVPSAENFESTSAAPHHFNLFVQPRKPEEKESIPNYFPKIKLIYSMLQMMVSLVFIMGSILLWFADIPVYLFSFQSGIPVSFIYGVSITATLLALIQLFPVTSFAAQLGLTLMSIAIISVHLILGSSLHVLLPALLLLVLTLSVICLNYKLALPDPSSSQAFD